MKYKVVRGSVVLPGEGARQKRQVLQKGAEVPISVPQDIIESLLKSGAIGPVKDAAQKRASLPGRREKWCVDPMSLIGKNRDQLCTLVHEIDAGIPLADMKDLDVGELVRMLTANWNEAFRAPAPAPVKDSSRPEDSLVEGDDVLAEARLKARGE